MLTFAIIDALTGSGYETMSSGGKATIKSPNASTPKTARGL
jgi:hypothetical protein